MPGRCVLLLFSVQLPSALPLPVRFWLIREGFKEIFAVRKPPVKGAEIFLIVLIKTNFIFSRPYSLLNTEQRADIGSGAGAAGAASVVSRPEAAKGFRARSDGNAAG